MTTYLHSLATLLPFLGNFVRVFRHTKKECTTPWIITPSRTMPVVRDPLLVRFAKCGGKGEGGEWVRV
jgi:hypothetical protein